MKLTEAQSRELLAKQGAYLTEACDTCRRPLGFVRFTRFAEPGEWCSRECRDGGEQAANHAAKRKGGRPQKYQTDGERSEATPIASAHIESVSE
jgi:hypothetical protein